MTYIIYDLEFNQADKSKNDDKKSTDSKLMFEVIQIGAIKVDEYFKVISTFNSLVKPSVYQKLHPYVENLTKIDMEKVNLSRAFPEVYDDFINFIGSDNPILCIWGAADIKELIKNIEFHKLPTDLIPKDYIDIQQYASKHLKAPNGSRIGLRNAVEILNIKTSGDYHDAYYDALYTFEVFKEIYTSNIKPTIYTPSPSKREKAIKEIVDIPALINQFEKAYSREMTDEEKIIIRTAYMMGKTRQFIIKEE